MQRTREPIGGACRAHRASARTLAAWAPVLLTGLLLAPVGCATVGSQGALVSEPERDALEGYAANLAFSPSGGSAIPLGDGLYITCRHVIPEFVKWEAILFGDTVVDLSESDLTFQSEIDGVERWLRLVAEGDDESHGGDWAVFRTVSVRTARREPPVLAVGRRLELGDEVMLLGFPSLDGPNAKEFDHQTGPLLVRGRVTRQPITFQGKPWRDVVFCVDAPLRDTYHGMSGGPVIVDDPEHGFVIVGIYRGTSQLRLFGLVLANVHVIRYLPEELHEVLSGTAIEVIP